MLKSKREVNISKRVYKRTLGKCEIIFVSTAFQDTRTDRSPISLKGGTLGMDRNVCILLSAILEQCFSLSQTIVVVSQI